MKIKFKTKTKESFHEYTQIFYYGIPLMIFAQTGLAWVFGNDVLFGIKTLPITQVSGIILLSQIIFYNRKSIYFWLKDWKKRNIKNGVLEI